MRPEKYCPKMLSPPICNALVEVRMFPVSARLDT